MGRAKRAILSSQPGLGVLDIIQPTPWSLRLVRWLLPAGWGLAAIGFLGPWVAHQTAALSLGGADLAEFVKFLPAVLDGSLGLVRQWFYLPAFAIAVSVALLIGSRRLHYTSLLQAVGLLLAIPVSLQLLPPAWSPSSLVAGEFRVQTFALAIIWVLLASFWLLRHLPLWTVGSASAALSLIALVLPAWQFLLAKPAIDVVYSEPPAIGWGFYLCLLGLAMIAVSSGLFALTLRAPTQGRRSGS